MPRNQEIEIKFRVNDLKGLSTQLRRSGFRLITKPTREMNALYDLPDQSLRRTGQILRLRKYGTKWVLTHKSKGTAGRHKTRVENESPVANGPKVDAILRALNFAPSFRYEKFRAEWGDGKGHVVVDRTPIGNFGEIEGPARWIDRTARILGIQRKDYITENYANLFFQWKARSKSPADEMTFAAIRKAKNRN